MKNGYYAGHGLSSVKEDIRRMCRDAIKYVFFFIDGFLHCIIHYNLKMCYLRYHTSETLAYWSKTAVGDI